MTPEEEARAVDQVARRLADRYPHLDTQVIAAAVTEAHGQFGGSSVRDYVPLFVERNVRERFAAEAARA